MLPPYRRAQHLRGAQLQVASPFLRAEALPRNGRRGKESHRRIPRRTGLRNGNAGQGWIFNR